ncbi:MAG TPA: cupin-like domain-containing protein [Acidimicrobiales bacterium]|nr:cupin-like domain-containing protein [Acidimicrobiales bacterium]
MRSGTATEALEVRAFERRFMRTGTPVVLSAVFDVDAARAALARAQLRPAADRTFLDELHVGPGAYAAPPGLVAPPAYVETDDPWESYVHAGGAGDVAHLHYDGDQRHVLMCQVSGRKRYVVIDPAESRKLAPGNQRQARRTSALFLQNFSATDLQAFLRYANAWDCVLEPGEALLIPAASWHYVEYVDDALSVSFRFGRNRYLRALAEALPEPSVELQALAARCRDEDAVGPRERAALAELAAAADDRRDALCVELCRRLGLPVAGAPYHVADVMRRHRITAVA